MTKEGAKKICSVLVMWKQIGGADDLFACLFQLISGNKSIWH
jgi:hypothetical protein